MRLEVHISYNGIIETQNHKNTIRYSLTKLAICKNEKVGKNGALSYTTHVKTDTIAGRQCRTI